MTDINYYENLISNGFTSDKRGDTVTWNDTEYTIYKGTSAAYDIIGVQTEYSGKNAYVFAGTYNESDAFSSNEHILISDQVFADGGEPGSGNYANSTITFKGFTNNEGAELAVEANAAAIVINSNAAFTNAGTVSLGLAAGAGDDASVTFNNNAHPYIYTDEH